MSKMLDLDEMLMIVFDMDREKFDRYAKQLESIGSEIADDISIEFDINRGESTYEYEDGLLVGFSPKTSDQPIPDALSPFDEEGGWMVINESL